MPLVTHFRELRVYERAFAAAMQIFELSRAWPQHERYSLTDQIRRSSRSVCGSIAEAWRKRRYVDHFVSKLSDADSEAAETQVWLDFALRCAYLTQEQYASLYNEYEAICAGLVNMMSSPEQWCGPSSLVREEQGVYLSAPDGSPPSTRPHAHTSIRPYTPADAPRVKAITLEGFAPVSIEAAIDRRWPGQLPVPWGERKWWAMQPELAEHPEDCFVAELDGAVVGYITTAVLPEQAVGRIPDLAVDVRLRGRGIGRLLLQHALTYFRTLGLRVARIETLGHNEVGRHLYPDLGFVEVATQIHYAMPLGPAATQAAESDG